MIKNIKEMEIADLAKLMVSALGGKVITTEDRQGFLLERVLQEKNIYQRIEIKLNTKEDENIYSINCEEGYIHPHRALSTTHLRGLSNVFLTSSGNNPVEEGKIKIMSKRVGRFTILDLDRNLHSTFLSGVDKNYKKSPEQGKRNVEDL